MVLIITGFFLVVADIGVLGVALKVAAISQVILTGLNFVFRPMVAKLYAAKDFTTLKSIYRSITRWIFILTLPLSFLFIFYPSAVLGLFGDKFSSGAVALTIIAIGYLFEYGTSATQVIINMTGKSWLSLMNQLISLTAILMGALVLIPKMGMNGAAVAVAAMLLKFGLFLGLLGMLLWHVPIEGMSFAAGVTLLLVACVLEALRDELRRKGER